jgi:hypothetical protein
MSDLIPEGTYEALAYPVETEEFGLTYVQFGEAKTGTPQVVVNTEICEGEQAGKRLAYIGYFTDDTARRTVESLRYFGFKGNDLATAVTQKLDQKVQIVVEHEDYEGKRSAKIRWVNRAGGGALRLQAPMKKDDLRRFAARMANVVRGVPDGGSPPAGRQATPATGGSKAGGSRHREEPQPPPPVDDDIPF